MATRETTITGIATVCMATGIAMVIHTASMATITPAATTRIGRQQNAGAAA